MTEKQQPKSIIECPNGEDSCPIHRQLQDIEKEIHTLRSQVRTDHLTGLYNIKHLDETFEQEVERTIRTHQPTSFLLLDIDHFKQLNDKHGHIIGDQALQHLGTLIVNTVRKIDIPCRYGGEEFGIILPSTPLIIAIQVAERVRLAIELNPLVVDDQPIYMTASVGVDTFTHTDKRNRAEFISDTDKQLYQAKSQGRNRVCHAMASQSITSRVSDAEKDALFKPSED